MVKYCLIRREISRAEPEGFSEISGTLWRRQTAKHLDGHGDSMNKLAQWGRFSENLVLLITGNATLKLIQLCGFAVVITAKYMNIPMKETQNILLLVGEKSIFCHVLERFLKLCGL